MKRGLFAFWPCFVVIGFLYGAAHADDGIILKHKFAQGDKLVYRSKLEMKQSQTIMGAVTENTMTNDAISSYTVESVDGMGNAKLRVKGERLKATAKFGMLGEYAFDSESSQRDKSSMIGLALTPLMERMSGIIFEATVPPEGGAIEVKGYADQLRDLVDNNPLTAQFAAGGTDDAAKQSLEGVFPKLPKTVAKTGDTWEFPVEFGLGKTGTLKGKTTYVFANLDKVGDRATAKLNMTTDLTVDINLEMDGAKVTGKISTNNSSGFVQFDMEAGHALSGESSVSMGGTLNVNVNGMDFSVQNDQTMKTTIEYLPKL